MCTHCSQPDSKYQRIYECPVSQEIRMPFQASLDFFQEKGWDVHELPFILQHENYELLRQLHYCQAEASVAVGTKQHLAALADTGVPISFYTDGAIAHPAFITCRYGAYAIVSDTCTTDQQRIAQVQTWWKTNVPPPTLCKLAMARTHGPQTIHRSELTAVVLVCEWCPRSLVHTDSTSVLRVFMRCRLAQTEKELIALEDTDMVLRLFRALANGTQEIHKVKAHQINLESLPDLAVYAALGNQLADEVATCRYSQPEIPTLADAMYH